MSLELVIFIVDGATFNYISRIPPDKIPTITQLMQKGTYGTLESTIPPISCPAWISLRTGLNPGKLGFYNFYKKSPGEYKIAPVNYKVPVPAFWDILSERGVKVAILNAHLTHPANKVNGVMVAAVYNDTGDYCYPETFKQELEKKLGKLDYEVRDRKSIVEEPLSYHFQLETNRLKLCEFVFEHDDFDMALLGFNVDRVQHFIKEDGEFEKVYMKMDEIIKAIIDKTSPQNVFIASDHGFGSMKAILNINTWLQKHHFLNWKNPALIFFKRVRAELQRRYFPQRYPGHGVFLNYIDWQNTRAFSPVDSGIYINLKGREPMGSVPESEYETVRTHIIDTLQNEFPEKATVYRREEIYSGSFLDEMPDIVYWIDEYESRCGITTRVYQEPRLPGHINTHRIDGIFIASGAEVRKTSEPQAFHIYDIAPTVLHMFNSGIPTEYDGKVMSIFSESSEMTKNKPVFESYDMFKESKPSQEHDDEEMVKRLRALGYID